MPYRHVRIDNLGDLRSMLAVRTEILSHLATVDRETDLFKVSQTMDLNNLPLSSPEAAKVPHLMALRTHMYSDAFRGFLERVTGCGKLSSRVDCAANIYSNGSHLLCHDDVITTRKLSYIIYLSKFADEDAILAAHNAATAAEQSQESQSQSQPRDLPPLPASLASWYPAHGGGLELFSAVAAPLLPRDARPTARLNLSQGYHVDHDHDQDHDTDKDKDKDDVGQHKHLLVDATGQWVPVPLSVPSVVHPPVLNSMVVFEVKPGQSFHAVQEVYTHSAKRVSIQGWFHFAGERPEGYDWGATVRLLQVPATVPLPRALTVPAAAARYSTALMPAPSKASRAGADAEANAEDANKTVDAGSEANSGVVSVYDALAQGRVPLSAEAAALVLRDMCVEDVPAQYRDTRALATEAYSCLETDKTDKTESADEADKALTRLSQWQDAEAGARLLHAATASSITRRLCANSSGSNNNTSTESVSTDDAARLVEAPEDAPLGCDLAFLRSWVHPMYTHVPTLQAARASARASGVVMLGGFLRPDVERVLTAAVIRADVEDGLALVPVRGPAKTAATDCANAETAAAAPAADAETASATKKKVGAKSGKKTAPASAKARANASAGRAVSAAVCTDFAEKPSPPPYATGVTPLYLQLSTASASNGNGDGNGDSGSDAVRETARIVSLCGAWRLRGPAYRIRACEHEPAPLSLAPQLRQRLALGAAASCALPKSVSVLPLVTAALRTVPASARAGLLLSALAQSLFASAAFARLLHWLTGARPRTHRTRVRRYRSGLDYTVGTYDALLQSAEDVVLTVSYTLVDQGQADDCEQIWLTHGRSCDSAGNATGIAVVETDDVEAAGAVAVASADADAAALVLPYDSWELDGEALVSAVEAKTRAEKAKAKADKAKAAAGAGATGAAGKGKKAAAGKGKAKGKAVKAKGKGKGAKTKTGAAAAASTAAAADDENNDNDDDGDGEDAETAAAETGGAAETTASASDNGYASEFALNARAMRSHGDRESKRALWDSDDCGGFSAHVPVDRTTEGDNAEEYNTSDSDNDEDDDDGGDDTKARAESAKAARGAAKAAKVAASKAKTKAKKAALVSISAEANTLCIVRKQPNVLQFTRYVNNMAPGSKWCLESEVRCAPWDDEDDEEEDYDEDEDAGEDGEGEEDEEDQE